MEWSGSLLVPNKDHQRVASATLHTGGRMWLGVLMVKGHTHSSLIPNLARHSGLFFKSISDM